MRLAIAHAQYGGDDLPARARRGAHRLRHVGEPLAGGGVPGRFDGAPTRVETPRVPMGSCGVDDRIGDWRCGHGAGRGRRIDPLFERKNPCVAGVDPS